MSQTQRTGYDNGDPICMHCMDTGDCADCGGMQGLDGRPAYRQLSPETDDVLLSTNELIDLTQHNESKGTEEGDPFRPNGTEGEASVASEISRSKTFSSAAPGSSFGDRVALTSARGVKVVKSVKVPVLHNAISRDLSNLHINWKKSNLNLAETHDGRDVCFSVYVNANKGPSIDNVTIGSLLHLPAWIELASTPNKRVEVLFVVRSKRGCVFVTLDETNGTFTFVKPIDIGAILEFLPDRKTVARTRISAAIVELVRRPVATKRVAVKRERCESWQVTLLALLESMVDENANDEQKGKLATLRRCMLENAKPEKKAKSTPAVSTGAHTS
jgi:hypothetical protein